MDKQTNTQNTTAVGTGTKVKSALKESIMQKPATKATESTQQTKEVGEA
jgi:hypothetical protein